MAKYSAQDRRDLAAKGHALPDGSFPIADVEDLKSAIRNWALGKQPFVAKQFIVKRAKAIGAMDVIPSKWMIQKNIQHDDMTSREYLEHFGVRGMKWGVRKEDPETAANRQATISRLAKQPDLHPNADGSIDIPKGSTVQRVVGKGTLFERGVGQSISDGPTYAAFTKGDRLQYESSFGFNKNLFVRNPSEVVTLTTKTALKAPTPGDTSKLFFKTIQDNPELKAQVETYGKTALYGNGLKALKSAYARPDSPEAYSLFGTLYDNGNYNTRLAGANDKFHNTLKKSGFNTFVDPSDSTFGGIYDAPIVILDGRKNLEVTGTQVVSKVSRQTVNAALKDYKKINKGKTLMARLGYDTGGLY